MPITSLDQVTGDPARDDAHVAELVEGGIVSESQVASARAAQLGLPFVELTEYPVDQSAVALVPVALLRRHEVLPIGRDGDRLLLAMADPRDVFALDDIRAAVRMQVRPVVAERSDLLAAIDRFVRADNELSELTVAMVEENDLDRQRPRPASPTQAEDDAPIVRFVNLLISQAIQDHASDIHIEPGERQLDVRYRIDGVLHEMQSAPKSIQNGVISRLKIMSDIDIAERRKPQDGRMSVVHGGTQDRPPRRDPADGVRREGRHAYPRQHRRRALDISDLHMLERNFEMYENSYTKPHGMILVTGPTGSGKSTTLYTTLHAVAKPEINVITVEDPVEYRMAGHQPGAGEPEGGPHVRQRAAVASCDPTPTSC